ncbi:MAG TPA: GntR family transcriptional regulator [Clostridia bacterium]|nr:GntR family transcriptional regulator [Clostridia bacterium]
MKNDFDSSLPIYIQIIGVIKKQIVSGERNPGQKVEPVREMAQKMGVNPNTIQKAFAELEREGLMYSERTSGRYITGDTGLISKIREETAGKCIENFVSQMNRSGFDRNDILRLVENYLRGVDNHGESCGG